MQDDGCARPRECIPLQECGLYFRILYFRHAVAEKQAPSLPTSGNEQFLGHLASGIRGAVQRGAAQEGTGSEILVENAEKLDATGNQHRMRSLLRSMPPCRSLGHCKDGRPALAAPGCQGKIGEMSAGEATRISPPGRNSHLKQQ